MLECSPEVKTAYAKFVGYIALILMSGCISASHMKTASAHAATDDGAIRRAIVTTWSDEHPASPVTPDVSVSGGLVILTGTLPEAQWRVDAVREAWQPPGVREVVDELKVPPSGDASYAKDSKLTIRLRAKLTFDPDVQSTDYSIESMGGVIYLMGIAHSEAELAKVQALASGLGATKVVSFVRVVPPAAEAAKS
jgi:osmotically-inducible protein OsmY